MATLQEVFNHARTLLNNGHEDEAMTLFDEIVRRYPEWGAGWFYKAYCRHNSDPVAAAEYYTKAVLYDKDCAHHVSVNLHKVLTQNDSNTEVENAILQACKTVLSTHPDLWEIRYVEAIIISNSGDYLVGLSEFYKAINNPDSPLSADEDSFKDYGLDFDMKTCQAQVRLKTLETTVNKHFVPADGHLFEYCYLLPVNPFFPYQKYYFDFGQYMGFSITEVAASNPHYIDWCIQNVPSFCVNEAVCYDIMKKGFGTHETLMLNTAKLQYLHQIHPIIGFINQSDYPDIDLSDPNNLIDLLNR